MSNLLHLQGYNKTSITLSSTISGCSYESKLNYWSGTQNALRGFRSQYRIHVKIFFSETKVKFKNEDP
jgi:uncharacterized membrane protein